VIHDCEYDHNLDEPCGKPANLKLIGMWMCAEHYDWTMEFCKRIHVDPFASQPDMAEIERAEEKARRMAQEPPLENLTQEELEEL
jgi:hypothetical protein